jgi:hypothetical protein
LLLTSVQLSPASSVRKSFSEPPLAGPTSAYSVCELLGAIATRPYVADAPNGRPFSKRVQLMPASMDL